MKDKKKICCQCAFYFGKYNIVCQPHPYGQSNCPDFKPKSQLSAHDKYATNDWDKPLFLAHNANSYFEVERTLFGHSEENLYYVFSDQLLDLNGDWAVACLDAVQNQGIPLATASFYQAYLREFFGDNSLQLKHITTCFYWQKYSRYGLPVLKLGCSK